VPVTFSKFHLPPSWSIVFVASAVLLVLTQRLRSKVTDGENTLVETVINLFELSLMASAVVALATTPLFTSIQGAFLVGMQKLHTWRWLTRVSLGLITFAVTAFAAWRFSKKGSWVWGILFGLGLLSLTSTTPVVEQYLVWFINNVTSGLWNLLLGFLTFVFNISFTVHA
jgi:hypothetical protein